MYTKGTHHMSPPSRTLLPQGKAIPTGNMKMNWLAKDKMKDRTGKARMRRTMSNRHPQGTGHSGKAGKHIKIPKVNRSGFYPLLGES
jgi:hypothetical protein